MGISKSDKGSLDRWHRNEGKTEMSDAMKQKAESMEGNLQTLKHGIFADRCLTPEEKVMFDHIIEKLHADFQFNKSSDFLQVELVGIYSVKLVRAQIEGNTQAAESLDRMIRCHMKDLKTTKISREGEERGPTTSPSDWATALLEKVEEVAEKKSAPRKKRKKTADNTNATKKKTPAKRGESEDGNA
ncbi:hypothetical protein P4E94_02265 [Pontiellaceae bacterium B12219]|nr:hypothetical protein [Pontiellaceae bacterium B12219]